MRILVCGGANYRLSASDHCRLDALHAATGITTVLSGGGPGAELGVEVWAAIRSVPIRRVSILRRGREPDLPALADAVVLFPGDRTVQTVAHAAAERGLDVHDWRAHSDSHAASDEVAARFLQPGYFARGSSVPPGSQR